jgi:hypothetical protein
MDFGRNREATKLMQQAKKQKWATGYPPKKRQKIMAGNGINVQTHQVGRIARNSACNGFIMLSRSFHLLCRQHLFTPWLGVWQR